jgi:hypothetical protein
MGEDVYVGIDVSKTSWWWRYAPAARASRWRMDRAGSGSASRIEPDPVFRRLNVLSADNAGVRFLALVSS